jgi:pimeloyl-ACP methyl ester carboxylesterase
MATMGAVAEGELSNGMPYLRLGQGPPLVVAPGLTSEHVNPTGMQRRMTLAWAAPFAQHFTVHLLQRRPGLAPGATMPDIASDYAGAIEDDIGQPVLLHGTSTGGSVALQLAIDRPELIQRMVVSAAACRLSPEGRRLQAEVARLTSAGEHRAKAALLFGTLTPGPLRHVARGVGWIVGGSFAVDDPSDMLTVIAAEDAFDAEPGLSRVAAPTLVLGGGADTFYTADLFTRTAAGIPRGRAVVIPGKSHVHVAGSKTVAGIGLGFLLGG